MIKFRTLGTFVILFYSALLFAPPVPAVRAPSLPVFRAPIKAELGLPMTRDAWKNYRFDKVILDKNPLLRSLEDINSAKRNFEAIGGLRQQLDSIEGFLRTDSAREFGFDRSRGPEGRDMADWINEKTKALEDALKRGDIQKYREVLFDFNEGYRDFLSKHNDKVDLREQVWMPGSPKVEGSRPSALVGGDPKTGHDAQVSQAVSGGVARYTPVSDRDRANLANSLKSRFRTKELSSLIDERVLDSSDVARLAENEMFLRDMSLVFAKADRVLKPEEFATSRDANPNNAARAFIEAILRNKGSSGDIAVVKELIEKYEKASPDEKNEILQAILGMGKLAEMDAVLWEVAKKAYSGEIFLVPDLKKGASHEEMRVWVETKLMEWIARGNEFRDKVGKGSLEDLSKDTEFSKWIKEPIDEEGRKGTEEGKSLLSQLCVGNCTWFLVSRCRTRIK